MSSPWRRAGLALSALAGGAAGAQAQALGPDGSALYAQHCASCHGAELEGQPNWRSPNPDGVYPAPPHSVEGHTWHHADAMLLDYVKRGGQAVLDDMGVAFASGMPAFGGVLTDAEVEAALAYIKSTWPAEVRAAQAARE